MNRKFTLLTLSALYSAFSGFEGFGAIIETKNTLICNQKLVIIRVRVMGGGASGRSLPLPPTLGYSLTTILFWSSLSFISVYCLVVMLYLIRYI